MRSKLVLKRMRIIYQLKDRLKISEIIKEVQENDSKVSKHLKKQMLVVRNKIGECKAEFESTECLFRP